jgi:hypothetical protein
MPDAAITVWPKEDSVRPHVMGMAVKTCTSVFRPCSNASLFLRVSRPKPVINIPQKQRKMGAERKKRRKRRQTRNTDKTKRGKGIVIFYVLLHIRHVE